MPYTLRRCVRGFFALTRKSLFLDAPFRVVLDSGTLSDTLRFTVLRRLI